MTEKSIKPLTPEEIAAAEKIAEQIRKAAQENRHEETSELRQKLAEAVKHRVISPQTARNVGMPPFSESLEKG